MAKSTGRHVGSINLKGKLSLRLRCGCCEAIDLRGKITRRLAESEMREGA